MAPITNTFKTYETVGAREELADVIYRISPEETPFMSNGRRGSCDATYTEWQTDALAAASTSNKHVEGDEVSSFTAVTPTVRLGNRTQISRKDLIVSKTQERVRKAGRKSEVAYQMAKRSAELKRDMEAILTSNQASAAGDATTARALGSILAFIKTNVDKDAGGSNPSYTTEPNATRTDGTQRNFAESQLKNVIQLAWTEGGKPTIVMVGAANKQNASAFAGIAQIRKAVEGNRAASIIGAADLYVSDFGNVTFVPNRFQRGRDALVLDPTMYQVAYLRPFEWTDLAKTGDTAAKKALFVEYTLKVFNEKALGLVADLTTTVNS